MTLTETPICNFGEKAKSFDLLSTTNKKISLDDIKGENGTLIMFICNHCPYVKAVVKDIAEDTKYLETLGIKSAAIMSNDVKNYPEDSFENMVSFSKLHNFSFPYLIDETQKIAKKYGAVCTPDFFGYNKNFELQYRGRIRGLKNLGVGVIVISHRMDDIFTVSDRVMALFQGTNFAESQLRETSRDEVIGWIMGKKI